MSYNLAEASHNRGTPPMTYFANTLEGHFQKLRILSIWLVPRCKMNLRARCKRFLSEILTFHNMHRVYVVLPLLFVPSSDRYHVQIVKVDVQSEQQFQRIAVKNLLVLLLVELFWQ